MDSTLEIWEKSLHDKNIIISGASTGLGKYLTKYLSSLGSNLAIFSRKIEDSEVANQIDQSKSLIIKNVDISNYENVNSFFSEVKKKFRRIDGLINCAGVYGPMEKIEALDREEFIEAININLVGTLNVIKPCIPIFKSQGYGRIVQLSGGGATSPMPQIYGYAASKAAVVRLIESIALEDSLDDILINSVAPGALNTNMLKQVLNAGPDKVGQNFYEKALKQKDTGGASLEKAARCISYLVSPENKLITSKLISAVWDPWEQWASGLKDPPSKNSPLFTLRREI
tara:strand:+ start:34207 stop:35061 length:855 start_codon:yes stop_codon:yes gene_type:complete